MFDQQKIEEMCAAITKISNLIPGDKRPDKQMVLTYAGLALQRNLSPQEVRKAGPSLAGMKLYGQMTFHDIVEAVKESKDPFNGRSFPEMLAELNSYIRLPACDTDWERDVSPEARKLSTLYPGGLYDFRRSERPDFAEKTLKSCYEEAKEVAMGSRSDLVRLPEHSTNTKRLPSDQGQHQTRSLGDFLGG